MKFPFLDAWRRWRDKGRYDLNKLRQVDERIKQKESAEPEPDSPTAAPRTLIYCHHCGDSMSQAYSICPGCGTPLGR